MHLLNVCHRIGSIWSEILNNRNTKYWIRMLFIAIENSRQFNGEFVRPETKRQRIHQVYVESDVRMDNNCGFTFFHQKYNRITDIHVKRRIFWRIPETPNRTLKFMNCTISIETTSICICMLCIVHYVMPKSVHVSINSNKKTFDYYNKFRAPKHLTLWLVYTHTMCPCTN